MKLRKLNSGTLFVALALPVLLITACNNSNKSENNSTSTPADSLSNQTMPYDSGANRTANTGDTSRGAKTATNTTGKRKGKVTAKLATAPAADAAAAPQADKTGYYTYTEVMPEFSGGQSALENYINSNVEYPQEAMDNNIEGTVNVKFAIDENGNVKNAQVTGTRIGYGLEEAVVQMVSKMPKWTPGKVKGKAVGAWYTLPVTFRLE